MTKTFAQATRDEATQAEVRRHEVGPTDGGRTHAAPADTGLGDLADVLNRSAAVQAQIKLGQVLNQSPRAVAQAKLARGLSQRTSSHVAPVVQRRSIGGGSAGERATQLIAPHLASHQTNLRVSYAPMQTQAPIQLAWRDYIPSLNTARDLAGRAVGGVIGGTTAAYLAGSATSLLGGTATALGAATGLALGAPAAAALSGIALGGTLGWHAGSAAASYLGQAAAPYLGSAASYVGSTVSGYLGSAASTLTALGGAATGAMLGERTAIEANRVLPAKTADLPRRPGHPEDYVPSIGEVIYGRAARRGGNAQSFLTGPELDRLPDRSRNAIEYGLERHYDRQTARPGQYAADTKHNAELTKILRQEPFIKRLLSGKLHQSIGTSTPRRGGLDFAPGVNRATVPQAATDAVELFNQLVAVNMSGRPINVQENAWSDPVSAMGNDGTLHIGRPAPRGTLLHELGHHLENNLSPLDFASVHNFLRARSRSDRRRRVGYTRLMGLPGRGTGYDTEGPAMSGSTGTSFVLSGLAERARLGTGQWADEFIRSRADDPISGYSSMIYDPSLGTEFLSTTIAYFDNPASAKELVEADPLRVCLFLSVARPDTYDSVRQKFDALRTGARLNDLIHRIR